MEEYCLTTVNLDASDEEPYYILFYRQGFDGHYEAMGRSLAKALIKFEQMFPGKTLEIL